MPAPCYVLRPPGIILPLWCRLPTCPLPARSLILWWMFDEPEETPEEHAVKPADRARDKSDEFRMHAELAAVFEAVRKFDARVRPDLDAAIARDVQRTIGRLEK